MPVNPILQKLLAAAGLTRRGDLVAATEAIQRTLAEATVSAPPGQFGAEAPTSARTVSPGVASGDVIDVEVREVEVFPAGADPVDTQPALWEAEVVIDVENLPADPTTRPVDAARVASEAVVEVADLPLDAPPETDRPRTGRFTASTFTAEAGTRSFKLFEPVGFEGRALPLLVMLHGCSQNPDDFAAGTRMNALAQEQGLYVLYPAQAPRSNSHKCWNWFSPADQKRGACAG